MPLGFLPAANPDWIQTCLPDLLQISDRFSVRVFTLSYALISATSEPMPPYNSGVLFQNQKLNFYNFVWRRLCSGALEVGTNSRATRLTVRCPNSVPPLRST